MKILVVYQSKYGFSKTYAQWLAQELGADLRLTKQVQAADLQRYDAISFVGGLYAGGVSGISLLTKNFECLRGKRLYLFTVGAADVADPENVAGIRAGLERVLTPEMREKVKIYHLRGGICYTRMTWLHRKMMGMMMKMVAKKPQSELRAEDRMMLETYGKDVDFTQREAIAPMVADIRADAAMA